MIIINTYTGSRPFYRMQYRGCLYYEWMDDKPWRVIPVPIHIRLNILNQVTKE